jgi:DNA-binding response OmpR family regulator
MFDPAARESLRLRRLLGLWPRFRPSPNGVLVPVEASPRAERDVGPAKVLLVEDEPAVREILRRTLVKHGYEVHEADRPEHAFSLFESAAFDLLITDVVMPGMSGAELARQLRERDPALPVLFVSGYPEGVVEPARSCAFLQKPFGGKELVRAARRLLEATPRDPDAAAA